MLLRFEHEGEGYNIGVDCIESLTITPNEIKIETAEFDYDFDHYSQGYDNMFFAFKYFHYINEMAIKTENERRLQNV